MRSREAWLAVFTAVLGVDAAACKKATPQASPAGSIEVTAASAPVLSASAPASTADVDATDGLDASVADADAGKRAASRQDAALDIASLLENSTWDASGLDLTQGLCGVSNTIPINPSCGAVAYQPGIGTLRNVGTVGTGSAGSAPPPHGDATISTVSGGAASDSRILAGLRPGMRACFNKTLTQNPSTPDGRVTLTISVAPNGEVSSVTASNTTLPADDTACVAGRARRAEFDPPGGTGRALVVTVEQKKAP